MRAGRLRAGARSIVQDLVPPPGHARRLGLVNLIHVIGMGLFLTCNVVFLSRIHHLPPRQIGLVLSLAGGLGFLAGVPAGRIVDRVRSRDAVAVVYALMGVLYAVFAMVGSVFGIAVVTCGITVLETANSPMRAALVYALFGSTKGLQVRAQMRSIANAGFALGALGASIPLALGTASAFRVAFGAAAVSSLVCSLLVLWLPRTPGPADGAARTGSRRALRNWRFIAVALTSGALEINIPVLTIGIPAWLVTHTSVRPSLQSAFILVNTVLVVLLQVRVSRGADTAVGAGRMLQRSGLVIAAACLIYGSTQHMGTVPTIVVLALGTVVLTWGELLQAAAAYGLAFELPPPGRQGEYQGVFTLGRGFQQFLGPSFITATAIVYGFWGWLVLAVFFIAAGAISPLLVRAALNDRSAATDAEAEAVTVGD